MNDPVNKDADQTAEKPASPKRSSCIRRGCIGLICLAVLTVVGLFVFRHLMLSKIPPETWARMQQMDTQVIILPDEWHQPATLPPPEVVQFHKKFNADVGLLTDKYNDLLFGDFTPTTELLDILQKGAPLPADKVTSLPLFLAELQSLLDEASGIVTLPGYTMELDLAGVSSTSRLNLQTFSKLASIAALEQARRGQCAQAMETALLPVQLASRPSQSYLITHMVATAMTAISARTVNSLADQCSSDPLALRRGIDLMSKYREAAFPGDVTLWRYSEPIGSLRYAAANGYNVDLSPQTLAGYYKEQMKLGSGYYKWIIDNLPASDPRVEGARIRGQAREDWKELLESDEDPLAAKLLDQDESLWNRMQYSGAKLILGADPFAFAYATLTENLDEMETRTLTAMAQYDLVRLRLAQKIEELEGRPSPGLTHLLVAKYLDAVPKDPFTGTSFPFTESKKSFYSFGPDKADNRTEIPYNATNGTISTGDIWMLRD